MKNKSYVDEQDEVEGIIFPQYNPDMSISECFDIVADMAEDCHLSEHIMNGLAPFLERVASIFGISHHQVMLLCAFLNTCDNERGQIYLKRYFSCSNIRIIRMWNEVEDLCSKGFLSLENGENGSIKAEYIITDEAINAIRKGIPLDNTPDTSTTNAHYVKIVRKLINKKIRSDMTDDTLIDKLLEINNRNIHLSIARELCHCNLGDRNKAVFTVILNRVLYLDDDEFNVDNIIRIFDDDILSLRQGLLSGKHELVKDGYIESVYEDGHAKAGEFTLTNSTRERFLNEFALSNSNDKDYNQLIQPTSITEKKLFYHPEDGKQIESLSSLLKEEQITVIRERLEKAGMRKGFCCLFYGAPGTGKTETVLQLARQTGRSIMQVDFSQIRDKWYGDTEKNVKQIFTDYHNMTRKGKSLPILLFNEADALLSVRQSLEDRSHSTDKTENAIQNIILQEMETFEGIMIATTNLTKNLDRAFERRFLYKVEFHRPTVEAKQHIWHAMLPNVEENVTKELAMHYDLTGGQIENVARKYMVNNILYGDSENQYENLSDFCRQETLNEKGHKIIGFA